MIRVAIIGAGPAGLMVFKRLVALDRKDIAIQIFEASSEIGRGMPYSAAGASHEHVTNVSADELPEMNQMLDDWILRVPDETLAEFGITKEKFHEKKVVPRLLFGHYLSDQFKMLIEKAEKNGIDVKVHFNSHVNDIVDQPSQNLVEVRTAEGQQFQFDYAVICTGHYWKKQYEDIAHGYFDSPYPPSKLANQFNHKVVIRGSSLTAIDAIKTIAKNNGKFLWRDNKYIFERDDATPDFFIEMHSREGLLPSLRVHMDEPHIDSKSLFDDHAIAKNMKDNGGFLELDFLFEEGFKKPLAKSSPAFYAHIKDMSIERFVDEMMSYRDRLPAFDLMRKEYVQSLKSIRDEEPVPWKEMLASLSFALNYPAKYLSAEDMIRLKDSLMPLIAVVIAFIPQSSCETLLALYEAKCLDLVIDGDGGSVEVDDSKNIFYITKDGSKINRQQCQTFIDCIGQKHFNIDDFPFLSLVSNDTVCGARLEFKSEEEAKKVLKKDPGLVVQVGKKYYLKVPGIAIDDNFRVVNVDGESNNRVFLLAVPYIGGYNPDYSGLDFCEQASKRAVDKIFPENN